MEFRKMRRFRQQLSLTECETILADATSGTLALLGDDGYPYAVPISHVYADGCLYFHSAVAGHKIDAIRHCDKASFCVIAADDVHPSEFTTYFKSVIVFGRIRILEPPKDKLRAATLIGERFNPGDTAGLQKELQKSFSHMLILRMDIEHISGKEAIVLTRRRQLND
ncbi:MAG: pyridoxamine 5'-phosphate oxidase family protein [Candidatus Amulumruptor sp.]